MSKFMYNHFLSLLPFVVHILYIGRQHLLEKARACDLPKLFLPNLLHFLELYDNIPDMTWLVFYDVGFHLFFSSSVWNTSTCCALKIVSSSLLCFHLYIVILLKQCHITSPVFRFFDLMTSRLYFLSLLRAPVIYAFALRNTQSVQLNY